MQIVIDIPEDEYKKICSGNFDTDGYFKMNLKEAFRNAIPLTKGQERLINTDVLHYEISKWLKPSKPDETEMTDLYDTAVSTMIKIEDTPTIIEADKAESDEEGMSFKGCIYCRKCEFIRGSAFCGTDKLTEKQLHNDKGYCSDFEDKTQLEKPLWWWKCERCGKLIPYMADFCHECAYELLGEPPKPFYPQAESEE